MVKFCVLSSGSVANSFFLGTEKTRILIDAGLSPAQIEERLAAIGERRRDLDAVLVTHEHGDHAGGLKTLVGKLHIPVFVNEGTRDALDRTLSERAPHYEVIQPGQLFTIGDIEGYSFPVRHDGACPVAFSFVAQGAHIGVATDLGSIEDTEGRDIFPNCDLVYLESNHDPETVDRGPYKRSLKARVKTQHLSNQATCSFIAKRLNDTTSLLILGHISENNNDPRLVNVMARKALTGRSTKLIVAEPAMQTRAFTY
jgi:phosphoribosyl 1,2-cyclic phosphodiesterase